MKSERTERTSRGGVFVVAILAAVFFSLLALIFATGRRRERKPPPETRYLFVLPSHLRVRTRPDPAAPVLSNASHGDRLELLEERDGWVQVKAEDGITGWSERSFLEAEAEHARRIARLEAIRRLPPLDGLVEKKTPLYSGPGIFYPIIGDLAPATRVRVYTRDHDFYAIDTGAEIAFADVDAVDLSGSRGSTRLEVAEGPEAGEPQLPAVEMPPAGEPSVSEQAPVTVRPREEEPESDQVFSSVPAGGYAPIVVQRTRPRYPVAARKAGIEGTVVIRAIIRKDGSVDDVQVIQDLPYGLGEAAREAVQEWRFRPARYRGRAIDVYYTVTVNFRMR